MRQKHTIILGRIFISLIFLMSALFKLTNFSPTVDQIAEQGVPLAAAATVAAIGLELVGGLSILTGLWSEYGSVLLILFLVPVTFIMHNFWAMSGQAFQLELANFLKNLALIGGLVVLVTLEVDRSDDNFLSALVE